MYKESRWAKEILSMQDDNGLWGYFHTLSEPNIKPITTEQALRRLSILGYTIEDESIQKTVSFMIDCLCGKKQMPDRREKLHDWDIFTQLMLSTWIRKFTKDNIQANRIADTWACVISAAFKDNLYSHDNYVLAYENTFGIKPQGGRLVDFVAFYQVSLISDKLDEKTEIAVFDYILNHDAGIYYIYDRPVKSASLSILPDCFSSKRASRYLSAIEILSEYRRNISSLNFVTKWLEDNRNPDGKWDMGSCSKDFVYFPLSDSWQSKELRVSDCTYRVEKLLSKINPTK